ncbi:hypothetical protein BC830DRAFT_269829 [Chytriomyces sp. MP71]|nr:hypothetical protein BC830DRAFT_269829 [Chytriomyces sp. MP71]
MENAEDTIKEQRDRRQPRQVKKPSAGSADTDAMFSALAKAQQKRTERLRKLDAAHAAAPLKPRYDHIGNEIDGGFTKDPVVFRWGCIVLFWLSASCILQWVMFALPNWRGDQYQTAGLFQVCSTVDLQFNPTFSDASGAGNLTIMATHEYTCQSVESYVNAFLEMVKPDPNHPRPSDRWYTSAAGALPHILASRYLEAAGTALDMVFGIGSVLLIMRPNKDGECLMGDGFSRQLTSHI